MKTVALYNKNGDKIIVPAVDLARFERHGWSQKIAKSKKNAYTEAEPPLEDK